MQQACHDLRNYSSMAAILTGVNSEMISNLRRTTERLEKPASDRLRTMTAYLSPYNNNAAYRQLLLATNSEYCVPWLRESTIHYSTYDSFTDHNPQPFTSKT
jgi:hypothetical protein